MGGSSYSDDHFTMRSVARAAKGVDTFSHDADVRSGKAVSTLHDTLNIKGKIRESRDSDAHPESTAIGVIFDVTGSMGGVPRVMQTKLPQLMGLLLRKGYIQDPQVLFGAVGDFFSDRVALQIGQFESGIEMDDNMTNLFLEGGGGGTNQESYQNAIYFFGNRTSCDCFEKRGKKGYLFLIGDENPYATATPRELNDVLGVSAEKPISTEEIVQQALEKWNIFFIIPAGSSNFHKAWLKDRWSELLGSQNVLMLEDPAAVCETIGLAIGLCEGTTDKHGMAIDLADVGSTGSVIATTTSALRNLADSTALARTGSVGSGDLPEKTGRSKAVARL